MNVVQSETSADNGKHPERQKLKAKLRNILKNVTSQESALQSKTSHLETWLNMHTAALSKTTDIKQRLLDFRPVEEDDDDETQKVKTDTKYAINMALDELAKELRHLSESEPKYRSKECFDELNERKSTITKLKQKNKALSQHNKTLLDKVQSLNIELNERIQATNSMSITEYESKIESMRNEHQQAMERKTANLEVMILALSQSVAAVKSVEIRVFRSCRNERYSSPIATIRSLIPLLCFYTERAVSISIGSVGTNRVTNRRSKCNETTTPR